MPTTEERLAGVRAKIKRAKEHINQAETAIQRFKVADPYEIRIEIDRSLNTEFHRVFFRSSIPDVVPLAIGDAIHNLRSSLDHLICRLIESNGQQFGTNTYFPICKGASEYIRESPRKIKGVSSHVESLIASFKPYKGGNNDLWILHDLDIIDKHQILIITLAAFKNIQFGDSPVMLPETQAELAFLKANPRFDSSN